MAGIGPDTGGPADAAVAPATPIQAGATGATELLVRYGCDRCHRIEEPGQLEAASLYDVGARLSTAEILRNLTQHEPPLAPAYTSKVTLAEVQTMTEYLATLQGEEADEGGQG